MHTEKPKNLSDSLYCDICLLKLNPQYLLRMLVVDFFNMVENKALVVSNWFFYHNKIISVSENANKSSLNVAQ